MMPISRRSADLFHSPLQSPVDTSVSVKTVPDYHVSTFCIVSELKRELEMRIALYPALLRQGKLSHATTVHRLRCLELAIRYLSDADKLLGYALIKKD